MRRPLVPQMMVARALVALAAACAAVVTCAVLAACGSDGKPVAASSAHPTATALPASTSAAPTASASATASRTGPLLTGAGVSPGERPPSLPAAAEQDTSNGALAFAHYFVQALDWSLATTDPYLLKQAGSPTCESCNRYVEKLQQVQTDGGYIRGGRIAIRSTGLVTGTSDVTSDYIVQLGIDQQPDVVFNPTAAPSTESTESATYVMRVYASWVSGKWQAVELGGS